MKSVKKSKLSSTRGRYGVLFTSPVIFLVLVFEFYPLLQAFYFSFTNWDGQESNWIGFQNFGRMFADPDLQRVLLNGFYLIISIPFGMTLSFVVAYLMHHSVYGSKLFRAVIFAPTALSWVIIGLVARAFLTNDGPINKTLRAVGLEKLALNWLANETPALISVLITFNAALFGMNAIIFLTGFSTLDKEVLEAAQMDGASQIQVLRNIVVPAMYRFIVFVFIITLVASFSGIFGLIYVMTNGGPGSATTTLEFAVWTQAFARGSFGMAAAFGIVLMVLTLIVVGVVQLLNRTVEED